MNKTIVTVGTVTYAIKLKKLLLRAGIRSELVKVSAVGDDAGCVHGVSISDKDFYSAVVVMKEHGVKYTVYRK